ncbi:MAG: PQQ-binding-like beta-propeller repeat protein [Verrucomicrobiae bacterium]|nr:PQQ-binding-like beta-propeller repeat protein [Verrucomicrobiae bacterium]
MKFPPRWFVTLLSWLPVLLGHSVRADWPEFRGPTADGIVTESDLPLEWAEDKNVVWKTPIPGSGWSTPAILGNEAWLTTAAENGTTQSVMCLDAKTGKVLFEKILVTNDNPEPLANSVNSYASSSPVIEDGRVYVHFGAYGTFCLDTKTREVLWQRRDLTASHWRGPASSPVLWKDKLILTFDGADQQYLVGLDKQTGKTIWRRDRSTKFGDEDPKTGRPANSGDLRKAYSTPIFVEIDGVTQMISNAAKACWAYDPETGAELWSVHYPTHSPSSRPVYSKELGQIFINTGLGKAEIWAVRADAKARGEISDTHVVWKLLKRTPKRSSPVLVGDLLFMANDGVAACADAKTGELLWQERAGGEYSASLISDGKHVWFFDEIGLGTVVKASGTYEKVAENTLDAGCLASPAVSDGALFVRTRTHLYRIGRP